MSEVEVKSALKSKTVWFNVLTALGTLLSAGVFPPSVVVYIPVAQALVNIGLRWVTTQPISINPQS